MNRIFSIFGKTERFFYKNSGDISILTYSMQKQTGEWYLAKMVYLYENRERQGDQVRKFFVK